MIELVYPNPLGFGNTVGTAIVTGTENDKLLDAALQLNSMILLSDGRADSMARNSAMCWAVLLAWPAFINLG